MQEFKSVDIRNFLTKKEFDQYMRPIGQPLILEHWMDDWEAMHKWTFEFFKEKYGKDSIVISRTIHTNDYSMTVPLEDYITYLLTPEESPIKKVDEALEAKRPFYPFSYKPVAKHPELRDDFSLPPFCVDWFSMFSPEFRRLHFPHLQGWVFFGPKGALTQLHYDRCATIGWLAQVRGLKRCILFSPEDSPYLYNGSVDPLNPDLDRYPLYEKATPYECYLKPGLMLFMPPNWWHYVVTLENTITLSYSFVNHTNLGDYFVRVFGSKIPEILKQIPAKAPSAAAPVPVHNHEQPAEEDPKQP